jgi:Uncharacterized protein conserved in bacteria (DUF2252)
MVETVLVMAVDAQAIPPRSNAERRELGRAAREVSPRESHAAFVPPPGRANPVDLVTADDHERLELVVPLRLGRMSASPLAFFRGSHTVMAADLATTPTSGLTVQLVGDAHVATFAVTGARGQPLAFEPTECADTLPGPWEWDVKRLTTSLVVTGRHHGFDDDVTRALADRAIESYASAMATFAAMTTLDVWSARIGDDALRTIVADKRLRKRGDGLRRRSTLRPPSKLTTVADGERRFVRDTPMLLTLDEAARPDQVDGLRESLRAAFGTHVANGSAPAAHLLRQFRIVDDAVGVTGTGDLGRRALLLLLQGADDRDHLVVEVTEALPSILEPHLGPHPHDHPGRRIIEGEYLVRTTHDPFGGWATGPDGRCVVVRRHLDLRAGLDLSGNDERRLAGLAGRCGWTLARAHARSGDPVAISGYLGGGGKFGDAVATFAFEYADQVDRDYLALLDAIRDGRIDVVRDDR